jgi:hypothetical protein
MANTRQENKNIEQQMRQLGVLQSPVYPSQNLVNPSYQSVQQVATKIQQLTKQGLQAKRELDILVATGKSKDLTGKILTFQDVDNMLEQDILKFYRIYQNNIAVRVNEAFSKIAIQSFTKLSSWL